MMSDQIEGGAAFIEDVDGSTATEEVRAQLVAKEQESLLAIKEDICQWLTTLLDPLKITPDTFMTTLDTGVALCRLAALIQDAAKATKKKLDVSVPMETVRCNEKAEPGTFFARDNTSKFIGWCRKLGVEEAVIFESEGLVSHKDEKRVILCLLDVARFAERVGIAPPQLVKMEREIEQLETKETPTMPPQPANNGHQHEKHNTHPKSKSSKKSIKDMVVQSVKGCCCPTNGLDAVHHGSGKFTITGGKIRAKKTLYARFLSDRVMVRVGGGWDTLEHFLLDNDPCRIQQIITLDRQKASGQTPTRRSPSPYRRSPSPYRKSPSPYSH